MVQISEMQINKFQDLKIKYLHNTEMRGLHLCIKTSGMFLMHPCT